MSQTLIRKKLIGKIYPTKHPVIYFHKGGLEEFKTLCRKNAHQENVKGFIIGHDVKMSHGRPYEITGFSIERPETDKDIEIIGNWTQIDREAVRMEFYKDKNKEYIWDLYKQEIKMNPPPHKYIIPDDSFGYFIYEETTLEDCSQEIPEYDVPQTHTQKEKLKIRPEELHKNKKGRDDRNDNGNYHTQRKKQIEVRIKKSVPGDDDPNKITISKDSMPPPSNLKCPFFDENYVVFSSKMYEDCYSNITDSRGEIDQRVLSRKINRMNYQHHPRTSPFFIFIDRKIENRIVGEHSQHPNVIGLLKGKSFTQRGKAEFVYLEIDGIIKEEPVKNFYACWQDRLSEMFMEIGRQNKQMLIGWFMRFEREADRCYNIIKLSRKWQYKNAPVSHFVGIIKSDLKIEGDRVNIISYNHEEDKRIKYECDEVYSFLKTNESR
jgi:hypothetical protein